MAIIGIKNIKNLLVVNENICFEKITECEWKKVFVNTKKNENTIQNTEHNKEEE